MSLPWPRPSGPLPSTLMMRRVTSRWRSAFNLFGERTTEAIELVEKAIRLNPRYPFEFPFNLGWAYSLVGRYEEAIAAQKQALLRNPNWLFSHIELVVNYRLQWSSQLSQDPQTLDRAFEAAQRMVALDAASPLSHRAIERGLSVEKAVRAGERERPSGSSPSIRAEGRSIQCWPMS